MGHALNELFVSIAIWLSHGTVAWLAIALTLMGLLLITGGVVWPSAHTKDTTRRKDD